MTLLVLGLVLFLGLHSVRIVADGWRDRSIARIGPGAWKGLYSVLSVLGFVLLVWGYGQARLAPELLWTPPVWTRHLTALLMLGAMVLLVAAYVPRNIFKARLRHPMVLSVKLWALAHLLANGSLADVLLFGSFLVWAVLNFRAARARDRLAGSPELPSSAAGSVLALALGLLVWGGFAFWAHGWLFGVRPFGGA